VFYLTSQEKKAFLFFISLVFIGALIKTFSPSSKNFSSKKETVEKININLAGVKELEKIPYIGRKIAQRIVEYRRKEGEITSFEELLKIKGIGRKKLSLIKEYICF